MNEVTLVEGMTKLVVEDLRAIDAEANWWHKRVRLVEHWLRDETSRVCLPEDGTEEMIRRHIQRGDSYPSAQAKSWKHIITELRDLPCFTGVVHHLSSNHDPITRVAITASPSRGKLRPGKELIVPSDAKSNIEDDSNASTQGDENSNNAASSWSLEPLNPDQPRQASTKPRPLSSATYFSRRELIGMDANESSVATSFAGLSLLERQMEWLRKKHDKMEAERLRQVEESERELTFKPKLIRRITYAGDRYFKDLPGPSGSRALSRSESSRRVTDPSGAALLKERVLPKVPRLSHQRRPRKKTPLQSASISQPVGVSCKLLDVMKSELEASLATNRSNECSDVVVSEKQQQEHDPAQTSESEAGEIKEAEPEVPETEQSVAPEVENLPPEEVPAWSAKPSIGGRRADFDSSETKVRLALQDASKFELSSMYRKTDRKAGRDGVALHVGRREDTLEEQVIAVLFDKEKVTQEDAERWWSQHQHRFAEFIEPQQQNEEEIPPAVALMSRAPTPSII